MNGALSKRLDVSTEHGYLTHMYGNIFLDLLVSFIVAYEVAQKPVLMARMSSGMAWLIELVIFIGLSFAVQRVAPKNPAVGEILALIFSAGIGCLLSFLFYFPSRAVIGAGVCTLSVFLAMTGIGFTTKKNLGSWSSYLFACLIGLIVACVINVFLHSPGLYLVISGISAVLFTLYIAYDTSIAKKAFADAPGDSTYYRGLAIIFGLNLFIDIINLFESLAEIFGIMDSRH